MIDSVHEGQAKRLTLAWQGADKKRQVRWNSGLGIDIGG